MVWHILAIAQGNDKRHFPPEPYPTKGPACKSPHTAQLWKLFDIFKLQVDQPGWTRCNNSEWIVE